MASKKRRGKSTLKSSLEEIPVGSPTGIDGVLVKQEPVEPPSGHDETGVFVKTEPRDRSGDEGDLSPGGSMSLDVLAQVASDRLESEPRKRGKEPMSLLQKKTKIKHVPHSQGMLSLEQIHALNDKLLVNLFANPESNELTRNFTYTCWLMPNCQQTFSSFGNEAKSKSQMKVHLRQHIATLREQAEEGSPGTQPFLAEPLPSLKKRVQADISRSRRGRRADLTKAINNSRRLSEPHTTFTTIKPMWASDVNKALASLDEAVIEPVPVPTSPRGKSAKRVVIPSKRNVAAKKLLRRSVYQQKVSGMLNVKPESGVDSFDTDIDVESVSTVNPQVAAGATSMQESSEMDESDLARCESEMLIIEWLQQSQPYHDHGYTSIFGQSWGNAQDADDAPEEEDMSARTSALKYSKHRVSEESPSVKAVMLKLGIATADSANTIHIPVIKLARVPPTPLLDDLGLPLSPTAPTVMGEEVVVEGPGERETFLGQSSRRYPPMPKCELARRGRLHIPEEEDESYVGSDEEGGKKRWMSASDNDRKMALKCIRELRSKKKDGVPLVCKICKSKMFTATATLMYHYRSHAGIKPFVCLICSETFTRQHSLNYHMLIHNNQNRFTCKDCGRKFRHPSHFKEHLRRHTGETPFSCTDCPLRFKTRNTYKRHLKTRHGKLLTAHGICTLPYDEYMKIRTRPYAQSRVAEDNIDEDDEDPTGDDISNDDRSPSATPSPSAESSVASIATPASNKLLQLCSQAVSDNS